jgi:hypothetical protein
MKARWRSAEAKLAKHPPEPLTGEEKLAKDAWEELAGQGLDVEESGGNVIKLSYDVTLADGKTVKKSRAASGTDLELLGAGIKLYDDPQALLNKAAALLDDPDSQAMDPYSALRTQLKTEMEAIQQQGYGRLKGGGDALGIDNALKALPAGEKELTDLVAKATPPVGAAAAATDPKVLAEAARQAKKKAKSLTESLFQPLYKFLNDSMGKAPLMAKDPIKRYQVLAALDWIAAAQSLPATPNEGSDTIINTVFGAGARWRTNGLDFTHGKATFSCSAPSGYKAPTVGAVFTSEQSLAHAVTLLPNRPGWVAPALWVALHAPRDVATMATEAQAAMATLAEKTIELVGNANQTHIAVDDVLTHARMQLTKATDPAEKKKLTEALTAADTALTHLRGLAWPTQTTGEAEVMLSYEQGAMKLYPSQDAYAYNRVGRFLVADEAAYPPQPGEKPNADLKK